MRQINSKGWFTAVCIIMLACYGNANADETRAVEWQTMGKSHSFNIYEVPGNAVNINTAISEILKGCVECNQVEGIDPLVTMRGGSLMLRNDCYLHADLAKLNRQLGIEIEKIHLARGWSLEELKNRQPRDCGRKILGFRIDIALQIIQQSSQ